MIHPAPQPCDWFKSSRSTNQTGCVEVRFVGGGTQVRDSKDRGGAVLSVGAAGWRAFAAAVKGGEYDLS